MKKHFVLIIVLFISFAFQNLLFAQCPIIGIPTNISSTNLCGPGNTTLSATLTNSNNQLLWLDNLNRIVGKGSPFSKEVDSSTTFKAVEANYDTIAGRVGPKPADFSTTFPSQNFVNGQFFSCSTNVSIDSMVLRSNNPISGNIVFWSDDPSLGGVVLQKAPFIISTSGVVNTEVPVGIILSTGNYFVNFEVVSGTGILYRATSGAVYPYTLAGLVSIKGSNFTTANNRYYYFFNWKVRKVCLGVYSAAIPVVVQTNLQETFPYLSNGMPCDWQQTKAVGASGWIEGDSATMSSSGFHIPTLQSLMLMASNDDSCKCNSSANLIYTPYFDFRTVSAVNNLKAKFNYVYKAVGLSKVIVLYSIKNDPFIRLDSLSASSNWKSWKLNLNALYGKDSVRFGFLHEDAGTNGSAVAIADFSLSNLTDSCIGIRYQLNLKTDKYGSEIRWKLIREIDNILIANGGPYEDLDPYNSLNATHQYQFCLAPGLRYKFKLTDSFGDGLNDGTNIGNYAFFSECQDTLLKGNGLLPFGGNSPLPNQSWDSVSFVAGKNPLDLGSDMTILVGENIVLDAGTTSPYLWSNGDTLRYISITGNISGVGTQTFWVIAGTGNCKSTDSIKITTLSSLFTKVIISTLTDKFGSEISWVLRDANSDSIIKSAGPYFDVIPYNTSDALHLDTILLRKEQAVKFKIIDAAGNGLFDGTDFGSLKIKTECQPQFFYSRGISFPYFGPNNTKFDSVNFVAGSPAKIRIGPDVEICKTNDSVVMNSGSTNGVLWSTGETTETIILRGVDLKLGKNIITVSTGPGECYATDTIVITLLENPPATINFTLNQRTASFQASTVIAASYFWDFGDGFNSSLQNVSHTYSQNGTYLVTLKVTSAKGCDSSSFQQVVVNFNSIESFSNTNHFVLFPNPANDFLQLDFSLKMEEPIIITIYDAIGKLVYEEKSNSKQKNERKINVGDLKNGIYFIRIRGVLTQIQHSFIVFR